jgi:hypothetical protein
MVAAVAASVAAEPVAANGNGNGDTPTAERGLTVAGSAAALGGLAAAGARKINAGAKALSGAGWRTRRQQLALAPVRLGTLSPRQLDRRADVPNIRRIGKLEPGFKT